MRYRVVKAGWTVVDLLRSPAYALPLAVNLTGSVWFFLLIGQAGESERFSFVGCGVQGGGVEGVEEEWGRKKSERNKVTGRERCGQRRGSRGWREGETNADP